MWGSRSWSDGRGNYSDLVTLPVLCFGCAATKWRGEAVVRGGSVLHVFATLVRPLTQAFGERERGFRRVLGETVQVLLQRLTERPEPLAWRPRRSPPVSSPLGFRG